MIPRVDSIYKAMVKLVKSDEVYNNGVDDDVHVCNGITLGFVTLLQAPSPSSRPRYCFNTRIMLLA